jgi:hypothetical protein
MGTAGTRVFDIRDYGATPGSASGHDTRLAIQHVLDQLSEGYPEGAPRRSGKSGVVVFPFDAGGWWVDGPLIYSGDPGLGIYFVGENGTARDGKEGSTLVYDGVDGGTLLDCVAINGSLFRDLKFSGNGKARVLVHLRQQVIGSTLQAGSSGVAFYNCTFSEPGNFTDSILVAAGREDIPGETLQSSEYRFLLCTFQGRDVGAETQQGWGFRALSAGNTKNFAFSHCTFSGLYRGVEAHSGYVHIDECNAGNIGGYGRPGGALFYGGGDTWTVLGGGMENHNPGYAARFLETAPGTKATIMGVYLAATPPPDDYIIRAGGALTCLGIDFGRNWRSISTMVEWAATTPYAVGDERCNGEDAFRCVTAGTSAAAGGPTGTGTDIVDGTVHWRYVAPAVGNVLRLQHTYAKVEGPADDPRGSVQVENCSFRHTVGREYAVPIHDGSNNHIGGHSTLGEYANRFGHRVYCRGNTEGPLGGNFVEPLLDMTGCTVVDIRHRMPITSEVRDDCTVLANSNGTYVLRMPFPAFRDAGLNAPLVGRLHPRARVVSVLVHVAELFSGPAGPIRVSVGVQAADGDQHFRPTALLKPCRVDRAGTPVDELPPPYLLLGRDPGDLGSDNPVGLGYVSNFTNYYPHIRAQLSADSGSLHSLTAGAVVLYLRFTRLDA